MRNQGFALKLMLFSIAMAIIVATQSRWDALAVHALPRSTTLAAQARPTLTPRPTEGPRRPSLCPRQSTRPSVPIECPEQPADICLRLSTDPDSAVPPASITAYRLVAHNSGHGNADDVWIRLPFATNAQTLVDATFSNPSTWVTAVQTDAIELRLGVLNHDQTITATLLLRTDPSAPIGRDLTTRARFHWDGPRSSGTGLSNRAPLVVAQVAASSSTVSLAIDPSAGLPTAVFAIAYDGFASNERVSLWYNRPDGGAVGLGEVRADAQGRLAHSLPATTLPIGRFTLVAYGQCSRVTAVGVLEVIGK